MKHEKGDDIMKRFKIISLIALAVFLYACDNESVSPVSDSSDPDVQVKGGVYLTVQGKVTLDDGTILESRDSNKTFLLPERYWPKGETNTSGLGKTTSSERYYEVVNSAMTISPQTYVIVKTNWNFSQPDNYYETKIRPKINIVNGAGTPIKVKCSVYNGNPGYFYKESPWTTLSSGGGWKYGAYSSEFDFIINDPNYNLDEVKLYFDTSQSNDIIQITSTGAGVQTTYGCSSLSTPNVSFSTTNGNPKLNWNSSCGAASYEIHVSVNGGNWSLWATTSSTSFTDSNFYEYEFHGLFAPPNDYRAYKVRGKNGSDYSNFSHPIGYFDSEGEQPGED